MQSGLKEGGEAEREREGTVETGEVQGLAPTEKGEKEIEKYQSI